jgi:hypothetical protein
MIRFLIFFSLIILTKSKSILPSNVTATTTTQKTTSTKTSTILHTLTTTISSRSTTIKFEEKPTTPPVSTTTVENDQSYEFHSNFSRNNDSVFVSLHLNASDTFISINNSFTNTKDSNSSSEIIFNECSNVNNNTQTRIIINFNEPFSRDLATQLGDRFVDFADLLLTVRSMINRTNTEKTV